MQGSWCFQASGCRCISIMPLVRSCQYSFVYLSRCRACSRKNERRVPIPKRDLRRCIRINLLGQCDRPVFDTIARWIHGEWPDELRAFGQNNVEAVAQHLWTTTLRTSITPVQGMASLPATLVASVDNVLLGTVSLYAEDMAGHDAEFGPWLASLYVAPEGRGHGVASVLLKAAASLAKRLGLLRLGLWFPKSKPHLLELYKKHGWEVVREMNYQSSSFGGEVVVMSLAEQKI